MGQFEELAARFGHSSEALKRGDEIVTYRRVNTLEELRDLMHDGAAEDVRAARVSQYEADHPDLINKNNRDIRAVHLRAAAHLFGDRPLSSDDAQLIGQTFPVTVKLVSANDKTIDSEWDLGDEAAPVYVSLDTLTINPGGFIKATATNVTFIAQSVVNNSSGGQGANFTIGIFGKSGDTGQQGTNEPAARAGDAGTDAGTPSPGICTGARTPGKGGDGQSGTPGGQGGLGGDGTPNLTASFTFNAISGTPLFLLTQSGAGGQGGIGGHGGAGGAGGKGGDGCQSGCEGTASADGGTGGNGGNGGKGGNGGSGVSGHPINVTLGASVDPSMFSSNGLVAPAGNGGTGGAPGAGGAGGSGGTGSGKHRSGGRQGAPGTPGTPGDPGDPGKFTGNPGTVTVNPAS